MVETKNSKLNANPTLRATLTQAGRCRALKAYTHDLKTTTRTRGDHPQKPEQEHLLKRRQTQMPREDRTVRWMIGQSCPATGEETASLDTYTVRTVRSIPRTMGRTNGWRIREISRSNREGRTVRLIQQTTGRTVMQPKENRGRNREETEAGPRGIKRSDLLRGQGFGLSGP